MTHTTLMELKSDQCAYPVEDRLFCGQEKTTPSYCEDHYRLCYVEKKEKTE